MIPPTENHEPYTDTYFLRSKRILEAEGLDPLVRYQFFIRKGPGTLAGMDETVRFLASHMSTGTIRALSDGDRYAPKETLMVVEGHVQELIDLETVALGILTKRTSIANGLSDVNLADITARMRTIVEATKGRFAPEGRPVSYFGARHWAPEDDPAIARAAYDGGATSCSTDIGAATYGARGIGTIPHALENVYAWKHGRDRAVVEATKAFDRVIEPSVPRIALIDYNNKEVDDAIATADALCGRLAGVRIDTCGENVGQGALAAYDRAAARALFGKDVHIPPEDAPFWFGTGVTVTGTYAVRDALDRTGHADVKIILSSGFGDPNKVAAFTRAEEILGVRLYDGLGVGGVYPSWMATGDIVAVGDRYGALEGISKVGRPYRGNDRLAQTYGGAA